MSGVLSGLRLAKSLSIVRVIVESNSKVVVDLIHKGFASNPSIQFLLEEILVLLRKSDWVVKILHISRAVNNCADILTQKGHLGDFSVSVVERSWPLLGMLVEEDNRGSIPPSSVSF